MGIRKQREEAWPEVVWKNELQGPCHGVVRDLAPVVYGQGV